MPGEIATRQADHQPSDVQPGEEFAIAARAAFFEAMGFLEEEGAIRFLLRSIRQNVLTDNGNVILDIHNLSITDPVAMEREINQIPGVVSVGLFARRPADIVIVGGEPPVVLR